VSSDAEHRNQDNFYARARPCALRGDPSRPRALRGDAILPPLCGGRPPIGALHGAERPKVSVPTQSIGTRKIISNFEFRIWPQPGYRFRTRIISNFELRISNFSQIMLLLVPALCVGTLLVPALCVGTPFSRRSAGDAPRPAVPTQSMVPTQSIGTRINSRQEGGGRREPG